MTRQLLRIATAGSVDDGKSTLIGRLMHDTDSLPLDHLEAVTDEEGVADLAALSDGLRAEREQGITIDVAYRFFSTETPQLHPGRHPRPRALHAQHVHRRLQRARRDPAGRRPRRGAAPDPQARPHRETAWASSTSWPRSTRSTWSTSTRRRFAEVEAELQQMAARLGGAELTVIPIAAKHGDNVVHRSDQHALVRRPDPAGVPRGRRTVGATARGRQAAAARAVGVPADRRRAPPLHRAAGGGHAAASAIRSCRCPRAPASTVTARGHPRRRPHDGRCAAVGLDRARRRHRRRPRRRASSAAPTTPRCRCWPASSMRRCAGSPRRRCAPVTGSRSSRPPRRCGPRCRHCTPDWIPRRSTSSTTRSSWRSTTSAR